MKLFWAASPHYSGVFVFADESKRDEWVASNAGIAIDEKNVDPEIVAAEKLSRSNHGEISRYVDHP